MFDIGSVVAHIKVKSEQFERGLEGIKTSLTGLSTKVLIFEAAAAGAFTALGVSSIKTAGNFEQFRVSFETMLGSADKARRLMSDIVQFTKSTPFELPQVVEGTRRLLAFGISSEKVLDNMKTLGNIAAGVGMDKLPQLILAFGQVKAATKLTGMELRQFTEAGVPLLEELAKITGKTAAQVKEDMEGGMAISFETVQQALENLTGPQGRFFDLMGKQSKTLQGTISNLKDSFVLFGLSIAGVTAEGDIKAGGLFDRVREAATKLYAWIQNNQVAIEAFGAKLGEFIVSAGQQLLNWLIAAWNWWNGLSSSTQQVILWTLGITAALIALLPVFLAIISAVTAATSLFRILGPVIGFLASPIGIVIGLLAIIGGSIYVIARNWKAAMETISIYWSILIQNLNQGWHNFKRTLGDVFEGITSPFRRAFDWVKGAVGSVIDRLKSLNPFQRHSPSLVDLVTKGTNTIKDRYASMFDSIGDMANGFVPQMSAAAGIVGAPSTLPGQVTMDTININAVAFMGTPGEARRLAEMVEEERGRIKRARAL